MRNAHRTTESRLKKNEYVDSRKLSTYEPVKAKVSSSSSIHHSDIIIKQSRYDHGNDTISIDINVDSIKDKETNLQINRGSAHVDTSS